jgi:hypothetical protein
MHRLGLVIALLTVGCGTSPPPYQLPPLPACVFSTAPHLCVSATDGTKRCTTFSYADPESRLHDCYDCPDVTNVPCLLPSQNGAPAPICIFHRPGPVCYAGYYPHDLATGSWAGCAAWVDPGGRQALSGGCQ